MERIKNSSAAIHDYRMRLRNVAEELTQQYDKTGQQIETVGETWKDHNFEQFAQNFEEDKQKIAQLCQAVTHYEEEILYKLEQKLIAYEGINPSL